MLETLQTNDVDVLVIDLLKVEFLLSGPTILVKAMVEVVTCLVNDKPDEKPKVRKFVCKFVVDVFVFEDLAEFDSEVW
jgi:hypothetical protein